MLILEVTFSFSVSVVAGRVADREMLVLARRSLKVAIVSDFIFFLNKNYTLNVTRFGIVVKKILSYLIG